MGRGTINTSEINGDHEYFKDIEVLSTVIKGVSGIEDSFEMVDKERKMLLNNRIASGILTFIPSGSGNRIKVKRYTTDSVISKPYHSVLVSGGYAIDTKLSDKLISLVSYINDITSINGRYSITLDINRTVLYDRDSLEEYSTDSIYEVGKWFKEWKNLNR